jgi:hypothetical protein
MAKKGGFPHLYTDDLSLIRALVDRALFKLSICGAAAMDMKQRRRDRDAEFHFGLRPRPCGNG